MNLIFNIDENIWNMIFINYLIGIIACAVIIFIVKRDRIKFGEIIIQIDSKIYKWKMIIATIISVQSIAGLIILKLNQRPLNDYVIHIVAIIIAVYLLRLYFSDDGIASEGIRYESQYYFWDKILAYTWRVEKSKLNLILTVESKLFTSKFNHDISITINENRKHEVEALLVANVKYRDKDNQE